MKIMEQNTAFKHPVKCQSFYFQLLQIFFISQCYGQKWHGQKFIKVNMISVTFIRSKYFYFTFFNCDFFSLHYHYQYSPYSFVTFNHLLCYYTYHMQFSWLLLLFPPHFRTSSYIHTSIFYTGHSAPSEGLCTMQVLNNLGEQKHRS